jgi:hypothetical protein
MPENPNDQISLFVRDEKTGRRVFNVKALQALGLDPEELRSRGYPLKQPEECTLDLAG